MTASALTSPPRLGRTGAGFSTDHPFLVALTTDPVLGAVKLIAEPWDVGLGGWQVGNFPQPMAEWNDRFRDYVRSYWLEWGSGKIGDRHHPTAPEMATRIAGSSDMFGHSDPYGMRGPVASVNFITAHDGFTARDLVTYTNKHNEANGENNRDGTDNNRSFNHGVEGETDDAGVERARRRSLRNLLGTLLLSAGTPMLLGGDEIGRTQRGSNNAYCQDNDINWLNWELEPWQLDLKASVARLIELRRAHRVLRPNRFYDGVDDDPRDQLYRADSAWFQADGEHEDDDWWEDPKTRVVQFMRSLSDVNEADALVIINGSREAASGDHSKRRGRAVAIGVGLGARDTSRDPDWRHRARRGARTAPHDDPALHQPSRAGLASTPRPAAASGHKNASGPESPPTLRATARWRRWD